MNTTKNIKKSCIDFFQNEDIKLYVREIMKPIVDIIYNEIYIYNYFVFFVFLF